MNPIRSTGNRTVVVDPWRGQQHDLARHSESHTSGPGLDSQTTEEVSAHVCGCIGQAGGFCYVCVEMGRDGVVCGHCLGHCAQCCKPICPAHGEAFSPDRGPRVRLCKACARESRRIKTARLITQTLLAPFVQFGARHDC